VALGRALASRPACLLLDEPVSALDEYTREGVCAELKRLQREFRLSVIHVCHSFDEARLVADRIGIMHEGRIVQTGTADGLMNAPREAVVANLLRTENLFTGEASIENGAGMIRTGELVLSAPKAGGRVRFFIRAWQIQPLTRFEDPSGLNVIPGEVTDVLVTGFSAKILFRCGIPLVFYLSRHEMDEYGVRKGARISVAFPPEAIHVFGP
jgi:ABC-type Fe3+/spermidine/putrescine transport system ATPase subunit